MMMTKKQAETKKYEHETPHDSNFKHNFSNAQVAKDFFIHNLPKKVLEKVDIETLKIELNEFIPSKYRGKRRADMLYSLRDKKGKKTYVLLHLEAQSTYKKEMAIRVWEYHVAIARAHLRKGAKKIPLILSIILYNGTEAWKGPKCLAEIFEDLDAYVKAALKAPFVIILKNADIQKLKTQGAAAAPQLIMKGKAHKDYCSMLPTLYPLMDKYDQVDDENVGYMATYDGHGEMVFLETFSNFDPDIATKQKTMFQRAVKKSKQEGIQQGIQEGIHQGLEQGKQEATIKMVHILEKLGVSQAIIARAKQEAERNK